LNYSLQKGTPTYNSKTEIAGVKEADDEEDKKNMNMGFALVKTKLGYRTKQMAVGD